MPRRSASRRRRASSSTAPARRSGSTPSRLSSSSAAAAASSGLQGSKPLLQSSNPTGELSQVTVAAARCMASGRGPRRGRSGGCGLVSGGCVIRVRPSFTRRQAGGPDEGRECGEGRIGLTDQPGEQFRQFGIGGHGRQLILPKVEKTAGQALEIRRLGHGASIAAAPRHGQPRHGAAQQDTLCIAAFSTET